ncbi:related to 3-oxoacyl-[acyl-carrier-protein] reductase [Cephalotrichum gorgonifer]|uniref:Related to 3-oxoacyl-[acyl-carrier-protein] reductase n=1 Tax=Cephalotrichum gorgonifer TaxID=2041049 RepID=A0AAE8N5Q8_9PEZI|nr:related to 3-oxoacyl-[acyl-carrier-protein] reductase [Cephalotrichum gorgonifer]
MPDFKGLELTGKTAIVTGASRGIGAEIARLLGKRGANVVVNYVSAGSQQRSEDLSKTIREYGVKAVAVQADISKVAECPKLIEAALGISETGKVEILIHNAALGVDANLVEVTEELFATHFDTNVKGPIFLTKAAEPHLPQGGRVVFVSSAAARLGVAGQTVYAATKAANEALARVWAVELGQSHGITVNCVNPGPVATDQWNESDEQFRNDMKPLIDSTPAAARIAEPNDIAPLVAFLCTEDARWSSGGVLCANGGLYN